MISRKCALQATSQIWHEIADKEFYCKSQVSRSSQFIHRCPCCQYVFERSIIESERMSNHDCLSCPLIELWPNKCETFPSVYERFEETWEPQDAREIADFADMILERDYVSQTS